MIGQNLTCEDTKWKHNRIRYASDQNENADKNATDFQAEMAAAIFYRCSFSCLWSCHDELWNGLAQNKVERLKL